LQRAVAAKVNRVLVDDENRAMEVIVPDDQLSLAIGKNGQNVRLAVKLTGWKIDVKSESTAAAKAEDGHKDLMKIPGIGEAPRIDSSRRDSRAWPCSPQPIPSS